MATEVGAVTGHGSDSQCDGLGLGRPKEA